ncbi:MAG: 30S ribosomal protein S3 [Pseudanabaenaceae cyanobacterium]
MGQKIHPVGLRLGITQTHQSQWFADPKRYPLLIQEDFNIRKYIETTLAGAGISKVIISRKADQVDIEIRTARPGVVIGRGSEGIEKLRKGILDHLKKIGSIARTGTSQIRIAVKEIERVDAEASLLAEYIAQQIEKRVAFRRVIRQAIQRAQRAGIEGIKIQISGRLNGAEIARSEWVREGRVPLHTLRADIDYDYKIARTIYGVIGIKVWIFKGEIIAGEEAVPVPIKTPRRQPRKTQFEDRSNVEG